MNIFEILRIFTHYGLHFIGPGLIAWILFRKEWKKAWIIMIATMIIDLDHLLANPIFDPNRCSIGFHPLHSYYAILIYFLMLLIPNKYIRIISAGLIFHMLIDFQDCFWILF